MITEATRLVGNFFRSKLERAEFWLEFAHSSLPGLGNGFGNGHFGIIAFSSTSGSMRLAMSRSRTCSTVSYTTLVCCSTFWLTCSGRTRPSRAKQ